MEFLLIFLVALLLWRMAFPGKKNKDGCLKKTIKFVFSLLFLIIALTIFALTIDNASSPEANTPNQQEIKVVSSTATLTAEPTTQPTAEPTNEATVAPTSEPVTLQEWAEHVAQSVYGSYEYAYTNLLSVSCEQVDGEDAPMINISVKYPDSFMRDNDERMSGFLFDAMNTTWKLADLAKEGKIEYGSVFIHGRTSFVDNYGNEIEGDAAQIRIKASEAEKVNWSYSTFTGDMMPGIAVSFGIHPVIREGLSVEYYNSIRK